MPLKYLKHKGTGSKGKANTTTSQLAHSTSEVLVEFLGERGAF